MAAGYAGYPPKKQACPRRDVYDASEADVLRALMQAHRLSQARLAKQASIAQSTISAVLNGGRSLTKAQVSRLARLFGVSPAAFFPA